MQLRELAQASEEQKLNSSKTYRMSFATPLTLLLNPLELVTKTHPNDAELQTALRNARRLLRLVNQLLDFQKLHAGKLELEMSPLEVTQFMRICTDYVLSYASSRAIDFQLTLDGAPLKSTTHLESPVVISADLDSLEKVVFNYLSNALKYTSEQGQIELGVEYRGPKRFESSSGIMVRGSLKSSKKLFSTFSQVEKSTESF